MDKIQHESMSGEVRGLIHRAHLLDRVQAHVICHAHLVVEHDGLAQRKERHHEHLQVSLLDKERH